MCYTTTRRADIGCSAPFISRHPHSLSGLTEVPFAQTPLSHSERCLHDESPTSTSTYNRQFSADRPSDWERCERSDGGFSDMV